MLKRELLVILYVAFITNLLGDDNSFDNFDDQFDQDDIIVEKIDPVTQNKVFSYYGDIKYFTSYNYQDQQHISSKKISIELNTKYNLNDNYKIKSTIKAYIDFGSDIPDDNDINLDQLYLQGGLTNSIDISIGRQIVVWGQSDNIRITDNINPLDLTTPAIIDIKDLRIGRGMAKLDYFSQSWRYSWILLYENRYSILPKYGSEYITTNKDIYNKIIVDTPSNRVDNSGIGFSLDGTFNKSDISFYGLNQYVDNSDYKTNMVGIAYNHVVSSYLLKFECGYFDNYDNEQIKPRVDSLVGFDYNGIKDGFVTLEIANKNNIIEYALRFNQNYLNERLDFTLLIDLFGHNSQNGGFVRGWFEYDYNDRLRVDFGMIDYIGGDDIYLEYIKDNDKVYSSVKYNF